MNRQFTFVTLLCLVLCLVGCTIQQREDAANVMDTGSKVATGAAGAVAGTPLAPLALPLMGIGALLKVLASTVRPKVGIGGGEMEDVKMVAMPGLLSSRKTKLQYLAYVAYGLVGIAIQQKWIDNTVGAVIIAAIAWVTKGNIDGIALEDSSKKGAQ